MNPRNLIIGLAALAAIAIAPAARAETVGVDASGAVVVTASPGENNKLGFQSLDDGLLTVYDSAATVTTSSSACTQRDENTVECDFNLTRCSAVTATIC
jgi:hypothetical protein